MRSKERDATDDRTTRARIRDAAITCFADTGVAGTSLRSVARAAGVSPALVIHHFRSKEGLRTACDQYVADTIHASEATAMADGSAFDPLGPLRRMTAGPPMMRYLARRLVDDAPAVNELVDTMVGNGLALAEAGVADGTVNPCEDEYARSVVLLLWSLGALVLHEQLARLLDSDLTGDLSGARRYLAATVEILGQPVLTDAAYRPLRAALAPLDKLGERRSDDFGERHHTNEKEG